MNNSSSNALSLGLVIPCYNEESVLPVLVERLKKLDADYAGDLWVLFINDGSADATEELLQKACEDTPGFASLSFSRNFGHQVAVSAGLQYIRGDVVAVIDADLQDPPEIIPDMIDKIREGYDVVYGVRKGRKENIFLRSAYAAFYRMMKSIANVDIPLDAGDFCVMTRRVVDLMNAMPERNRFVRGLRSWTGFSQYPFPYDRAARQAGETKYSLAKLMRLATDGLVNFSSLPLRFASWIGVSSAAAGVLLLIWAVASKLLLDKTPQGWTSLVVLMLFFGGIQLMVLGIIGEYLGRMFDEVKARPQFIEQSRKGWLEEHTT